MTTPRNTAKAIQIDAALPQRRIPLWRAVLHAAISLIPESGVARIYRRIVFQRIYTTELWGSEGTGLHFSGHGSRGTAADVYVEAITPLIQDLCREYGDETTIVDLGCGDFHIGNRLLQQLPPLRYIGCDIAPSLVQENTSLYGKSNISFHCLDIVSDGLPSGHIYLLRQVLQHLSNKDISRVLKKLEGKQHVYITEAHPATREGPVNPDKPIGGDVRFRLITGRGRGVELDQPPFYKTVEEVCRASHAGGLPKEIIITHRIVPISQTSPACAKDVTRDWRRNPYAAQRRSTKAGRRSSLSLEQIPKSSPPRDTRPLR